MRINRFLVTLGLGLSIGMPVWAQCDPAQPLVFLSNGDSILMFNPAASVDTDPTDGSIQKILGPVAGASFGDLVFSGDGFLYGLDEANGRLFRFDPCGPTPGVDEFFDPSAYGTPVAGDLTDPTDLTVTDDGSVIVSDALGNGLFEFPRLAGFCFQAVDPVPANPPYVARVPCVPFDANRSDLLIPTRLPVSDDLPHPSLSVLEFTTGDLMVLGEGAKPGNNPNRPPTPVGELYRAYYPDFRSLLASVDLYLDSLPIAYDLALSQGDVGIAAGGDLLVADFDAGTPFSNPSRCGNFRGDLTAVWGDLGNHWWVTTQRNSSAELYEVVGCSATKIKEFKGSTSPPYATVLGGVAGSYSPQELPLTATNGSQTLTIDDSHFFTLTADCSGAESPTLIFEPQPLPSVHAILDTMIASDDQNFPGAGDNPIVGYGVSLPGYNQMAAVWDELGCAPTLDPVYGDAETFEVDGYIHTTNTRIVGLDSFAETGCVGRGCAPEVLILAFSVRYDPELHRIDPIRSPRGGRGTETFLAKLSTENASQPGTACDFGSPMMEIETLEDVCGNGVTVVGENDSLPLKFRLAFDPDPFDGEPGDCSGGPFVTDATVALFVVRLGYCDNGGFVDSYEEKSPEFVGGAFYNEVTGQWIFANALNPNSQYHANLSVGSVFERGEDPDNSVFLIQASFLTDNDDEKLGVFRVP